MAVLWVLNPSDGHHSLDIAERADLPFDLVAVAASAPRGPRPANDECNESGADRLRHHEHLRAPMPYLSTSQFTTSRARHRAGPVKPTWFVVGRPYVPSNLRFLWEVLVSTEPTVRLEHAGTCRFCRHSLSHSFLDLGMSPPCQAHIEPQQLDCMEAFYPLHALVCEKCLLVQLGEYVAPDNIFTEYAYFSS